MNIDNIKREIENGETILVSSSVQQESRPSLSAATIPRSLRVPTGGTIHFKTESGLTVWMRYGQA